MTEKTPVLYESMKLVAAVAPSVVPNNKEHLLSGYENLPLVDLISSVASIEQFVSDVHTMVGIIQQTVVCTSKGLTEAESGAIKLLTMEWYPLSSSFHHVLNQVLRSNNKQMIEPWFPYLKLLFKALSKLDTVTHMIFCRVSGDKASQYILNATITDWQFHLCTTALSTFDDDEWAANDEMKTLLSVNTITAKDIHEHAFEPTKYQLLLLPGRKFHAESSLDAGNQLRIVQLNELEPDIELQ
jgi:hypothetical protein